MLIFQLDALLRPLRPYSRSRRAAHQGGEVHSFNETLTHMVSLFTCSVHRARHTLTIPMSRQCERSARRGRRASIVIRVSYRSIGAKVTVTSAPEANLALWEEMKAGTPRGQQCCLRIKMDMSVRCGTRLPFKTRDSAVEQRNAA